MDRLNFSLTKAARDDLRALGVPIPEAYRLLMTPPQAHYVNAYDDIVVIREAMTEFGQVLAFHCGPDREGYYPVIHVREADDKEIALLLREMER